MHRLFLSIFLLIITQAAYANTIQISGLLVDEKQQPIVKSKVTVNENIAISDVNGRYHISVKPSDIYQVSINKSGYYSAIQSFSHYELISETKKIANIGDITLVAKKDQRVMLAFGGDVMMGRRYYKPYFGDEILIEHDNKLAGSKAVVANVKPYFTVADYAAVNLETQIATSKPKHRAPKGVTFYSQPEILAALSWAGIDYVTLGNNHTYDYMDSGLHSTLAALKQSDLGYSGAGVNTQDALKAFHETVNNNELSMLGYVGWEGSANPTQTANQEHGGAAYGSMENILTSVKREVAQQKITIVQYHGSQEYASTPTGVTEQRLKSALDNGAALAVAHHPHVTQGLELYNGKLIAYSMGNFIFDQNFSATQHSFMLYVWLDEGEFHRAEIVPIYVKGYKPTPATGIQRNTVMRRLKTLSQARNTHITMNAGHGVITPINQVTPVKATQHTLRIDTADKAKSLYHLPWNNKIEQVLLPSNDLQYRLGVNLINGSNLENFASFNSAERGWLFDRATTTPQIFSESASSGLQLQIANNSSQWFGMQVFRRVFKASYPMTINTQLRVKGNDGVPLKANFYWQGRKRKDKFFDALNNREKHLIGSVDLNQENLWQAVSLDFNSPRVGYRSYRVLVEFENTHNETVTLDIDDFSLIEWQTAFSNTSKPASYDDSAQLATFIGLNKATAQPITIEVSDY